MSAAISIQAISKNYGALQALDQVSLKIEQGEFFGLLGPNGAGKTTLISILAGLVKADHGHAAIMGADVQKIFVKRAVCLEWFPKNWCSIPSLRLERLCSSNLDILGFVIMAHG